MFSDLYMYVTLEESHLVPLFCHNIETVRHEHVYSKLLYNLADMLNYIHCIFYDMNIWF